MYDLSDCPLIMRHLARCLLVLPFLYVPEIYGQPYGQPNVAALGPTVLQASFWGGVDSYGCSPGEPAYYAGGTYALRVTLRPEGKRSRDIEYKGVTDWSWPEGLTLRVSHSSDSTRPFRHSASLLERMQFEYYVPFLQAVQDSLWRTGASDGPKVQKGPEYYFAFRIPAELAGSYLSVDVEWQHPVYGRLTIPAPCRIRVAAPCSERARDQAWGTRVRVAVDQRRYEPAVALADSLAAMGWHDFWGLLDASAAASHLGRYDEAIRYLDLCFEGNHTVTPSEERLSLTAPTEQTRRSYESVRARLVELRDQQQQR